MFINMVPFYEVAAVGLAAHAIERKLERAGHGGRVILVRLSTYVVCALITLVEYGHVFRYVSHMFHL